MRLPIAAALAAALLLPAVAAAQDALDPNPTVWHGIQFGPEQAFEGDYTVNIQTSAFHADGGAKGADDWLAGWQDRPGDDGGIIRRYHIRFVGRRTTAAGSYGPGGRYPGEVLIDRLVSARLLIGGG